MRVEISYKFIIGFLVVVVSGVLVDLAIPYSAFPVEFHQALSIACAMVIGLIGGLLPALQATRQPVATALREL